MKFFLHLYHFLGSVFFAIVLILLTALFVIAGTVIESQTESHRYAATFTYHSPLFAALLWGFFLNILISALRRWPFRFDHIPFLITHLGLLMILGGTLIKNHYGIQGVMYILEGSGTDELLLPETYAIAIETRDGSRKTHPLKSIMSFDDLHIALTAFTPHAKERWDTWLKGDHGSIIGCPSFPVRNWKQGSVDNFSPCAQLHMQGKRWNLFAGDTTDVEAIAKQLYVEGTTIILSDCLTNQTLYQGQLSDSLKDPITFPGGTAHLSLQFHYSPVVGFQDTQLLCTVHYIGKKKPEQLTIPLKGDNALLNCSRGHIAIDLNRIPTLALLRDALQQIHLIAYDTHGQVHHEPVREHTASTLVIYDRGLGGYAVQATLPFLAYPNGRREREEADLLFLKNQLRRELGIHSTLSPPLQLLKNACDIAQEDFVDTLLNFLSVWHRSNQWLLTDPSSLANQNVLQSLDWNSVPARDLHACQWITTFVSEIEPKLHQGEQLLTLLEKGHWPQISQLKELQSNEEELYTALTQQIFSIGEHLPKQESVPRNDATLLSAYLRAYQITLASILPKPTLEERNELLNLYALSQLQKGIFNKEEVTATPLTLESYIVPVHQSQPPMNKLEENTPAILIRVAKDKQTEQISLLYDRNAQSLQWPILGGQYLVRFQPQTSALPYRVRLHQARKISYPHSDQAYSYESDLIIKDGSHTIETTLSMNHVYETWDGYRFYLSNIGTTQSGLKRIQLIVNHDPAKYWLTYPGALILTLGILLLFWLKSK